MTSNEISTIKQRLLNEQFVHLKSITDQKRSVPNHIQFQNPINFPPITQNAAPRLGIAHSLLESPKSSLTNYSAARFSFAQSNAPSLASRSSFFQFANHLYPKRSTRYDHIQSKIDTGLPRLDNLRTERDTNQLGPSHKINWSRLKQELEENSQIRAQAKRLQYNSGVTYTTQLTTLSNLVRTKVKSYLGEERYKIIVQLHVFPTSISGLHIGSRCLWNVQTDNSITFKMQGIDCDLLFVVFLCYTDLGAT